MKTRTCSKCQSAYTHYGQNRSYCKPCKQDYQRKYYAKNPAWRASIRKHSKAKAKRRHAIVRRYKQMKGCACCGINDWRILEFDHREAANKVASVSVLINNSSSWQKIKAEIAKCDVLCCNCHRIKTFETEWEVSRAG